MRPDLHATLTESDSALGSPKALQVFVAVLFWSRSRYEEPPRSSHLKMSFVVHSSVYIVTQRHNACGIPSVVNDESCDVSIPSVMVAMFLPKFYEASCFIAGHRL